MPARLTELAALFLKLGTIGFGGPAAHLATMEEEVVQRRKWLSRDHFLDLIGATHLIPGPNSTEMAMHIGFHRAGWWGLIVAGVSFIGPAFLITTVLAWVYVDHGHVPKLQPLMTGIQAAVLSVIFVAGWRLARRALRGWPSALVAVGVGGASMAGVSPIRALLIGSLLGLLAMYWLRRGTTDQTGGIRSGTAAVAAASLAAGTSATARAAWPLPFFAAAAPMQSPALTISLVKLAAFFLKVGVVLYGSGYVLIAYLEDELVGEYGWLTQRQLLDSIAIGQLTPGPILTSATFIGYVVMGQHQGSAAGLLGAVVATAAIFLPSFLIVAAVNPLIPRLRNSRVSSAFLDAVNAASIGLMAAVTWKLCSATVTSWQTVFIAIGAIVMLLAWRIAPAWIVLAGALAGWIFLPK